MKSLAELNYAVCCFMVLMTFYHVANGKACGQEELTECARPLQALQTTSELSIVVKKEELNKLCPDLDNAFQCIRSYTRRCMSLQQRNQFYKLYHGTNQVIRDLCKEGPSQDEFLYHAPCLKLVQEDYEICSKRYQKTIAFINSENVTATEDENIKTVCCSFIEYLDCSEQAARRTCGEESAQFTRNFLNKMSSTLVKTYCDSYYKGSGRCSEFESSGSNLRITEIILFTFPLAILSLSKQILR